MYTAQWHEKDPGGATLAEQYESDTQTVEVSSDSICIWCRSICAGTFANLQQDLSTLVSCTFFVNWPPAWYLPHPALLLVKVWDIQIAVRDWNAAVQYIQVAMLRENIFPYFHQITRLTSLLPTDKCFMKGECPKHVYLPGLTSL